MDIQKNNIDNGCIQYEGIQYQGMRVFRFNEKWFVIDQLTFIPNDSSVDTPSESSSSSEWYDESSSSSEWYDESSSSGQSSSSGDFGSSEGGGNSDGGGGSSGGGGNSDGGGGSSGGGSTSSCSFFNKTCKMVKCKKCGFYYCSNKQHNFQHTCCPKTNACSTLICNLCCTEWCYEHTPLGHNSKDSPCCPDSVNCKKEPCEFCGQLICKLHQDNPGYKEHKCCPDSVNCEKVTCEFCGVVYCEKHDQHQSEKNPCCPDSVNCEKVTCPVIDKNGEQCTNTFCLKHDSLNEYYIVCDVCDRKVCTASCYYEKYGIKYCQTCARTQCKKCNDTDLYIDELYPCELCGQELCSSCLNTCNTCGKKYCEQHYDIEFKQCKSCKEKNIPCDVCGVVTTNIQLCHTCNKAYCVEHYSENIKNCYNCNQKICTSCQILGILNNSNDTPYCMNCAESLPKCDECKLISPFVCECNSCTKILCTNHMSICKKCGEYVCNDDYSEGLCKKCHSFNDYIECFGCCIRDVEFKWCKTCKAYVCNDCGNRKCSFCGKQGCIQCISDCGNSNYCANQICRDCGTSHDRNYCKDCLNCQICGTVSDNLIPCEKCGLKVGANCCLQTASPYFCKNCVTCPDTKECILEDCKNCGMPSCLTHKHIQCIYCSKDICENCLNLYEGNPVCEDHINGELKNN